MKQIKLNGKKFGLGKFALVDDEDFEEQSKYNWHLTHLGYVCRSSKRRKDYTQYTIFLHREVCHARGRVLVDHKDGNRLNNQKNNLRICSVSQNMMNRGSQKNNTSGYKGVMVDKRINKNDKCETFYIAIIGVNWGKIYLGEFKKKEDAAIAYNNAAIKYHGEFARLNKIER